MAKRRKSRKKMSPGRRASSRLRSVWKKRTRSGGKYASYGAVVRTTKSGSPRRGRKKHAKGKGHAWTGRKGTVALYSRKTGKLWATNPKRGRGRGRRYNPDPVAAVAASIPASVPTVIAKAAVAGAAAAVAKTNPRGHRGGRNKRRGSRSLNEEGRYETNWRGQAWRARMKDKSRSRRGRR